MAISSDPDLIIADEPTTALDVVVQDEILSELAELQEEFGVALLVISHDIGVMAEVCDEVGVMYAGEMMEIGTAEDIFVEPSNPYTLGLKNSFPDIEATDRELISIPGTAPDLAADRDACPFVDRCPFAEPECRAANPGMHAVSGDADHRSRCHFVDEADRLREDAADPDTWGSSVDVSNAKTDGDGTLFEVDDLEKYFNDSRGLVDTLLRRESTPIRAVDGVSFEVREGEIFGIVGESGCGKSTLGRTLLDLEPATDGEIQFRGRSLEATPNADFRRAAQIIFQDPFESLNPRLTVRQTLMEPIALLGEGASYSERLEVVRETLADVGLAPPEEYLDRFPEQLSGGERQRVSVARALVVDPSFLLADEPVSMLDVSIRASILNILRRLRNEEGLTLSIISHDLSLIRNISDRTAVMYLGEFVEMGDTDRLVEDPKHPYTQALVDSVPVPDPTRERTPADIRGEPPSVEDPPSGCRFHTRCPKVIPPEEYEFDQERYREVMDLRVDLARDAVRVDIARRRADADDPEGVAAELKAERFSGGFTDPDAEAVVDDAIDHLVEDDPDEAARLLADEFESPCERTAPEYRKTDDGQLVACHLY
jgi:peptide/nickel transport system ATP-binding protein